MAKRMLIDATHQEETRVVVLNENRLEEFDFESANKKQIKGNIYLAKVMRVEPSLQACFVEYGGNRHGFLPFSEIHPDYYRIPQSDREQLLSMAREEEAALEEAMEANTPSALAESTGTAASDGIESAESPESPEPIASSDAQDATGEDLPPPPPPDTIGGDAQDLFGGEAAVAEVSEITEAGDAGEDKTPTEYRSRRRPMRHYKIQDVIVRRQILLIQVVKEERGSKGAALTTYLSLAGRYCVLMPNAPRGGGVSRKITSLADRKRLKAMVDEFELPESMGVIVRTAGMERPKTEIRRDLDYLLRLWNTIRDTTLNSMAPCLIHEEGDLIKRSIRDLYARDIDEILVAGEEGYKTAKSFMQLILPSHSKRVQPYRDETVPIMQRYQVELQLDAIHSPIVQLKSGGYIVINPTEALVAIDVNSGRATRERGIEETAVKTNLEAVDEVARQIRLRDLAGLIVIDFIDMEDRSNIHAVERRIREAMKNDRARIQIGGISSFGLLELSRQRLRSSLLEASSEICPHCQGTGRVRSTESTALHVLRGLEEEGMARQATSLALYVPTDIAFYILNHKRQALASIEQRYGFTVELIRDDLLYAPAFRIERRELAPKTAPRTASRFGETELPALAEADLADESEHESDIAEMEETSTASASNIGAEDEAEHNHSGQRNEMRRPRSRRRGTRGRDGGRDVPPALPPTPRPAPVVVRPAIVIGDSGDASDSRENRFGTEAEAIASEKDAHGESRRRRGRRGGRRHGGRRDSESPHHHPSQTGGERSGNERSGGQTYGAARSISAPPPAYAPPANDARAGTNTGGSQAAAASATTEDKPKRRFWGLLGR